MPRKITYQVLSEDELNQIHEATLNLLEEPGIQFSNDAVRQYFVDAGFRVSGKVVHFTREQVEAALKTAPRTITRQAFKPEYTFTKGDGGLYLSAGSWPLYVVDANTYARRQATFDDLGKFTRLADAMDNLIIANGVVKPCDVPENVLHVVWSWNLLNNTYKVANTTHALTVQEAQDILHVLTAAFGSFEALKKTHAWTITCCLDQAMVWGDTLVGAVEMAKAELPVVAMSMPMPGSMHPVTLAGTLVQANAEVLSAVVLTQLVNPGAPVIYTYYAGIMDMRVASHVFGAPEVALIHAAGAQLAKWYGLPCDMCSGHTDSKVPDAQAAAEKMLTMLPPALAGTDCLRLVAGELDFGLSASYEQLVIDNEMAGEVLRIGRGVEVNPETLALDVIKRVGLGGNYLGERHTLKHFKEELWLPPLADRRGRDVWESKGGLDILQRAQGRVADILEKHHPRPLSEERRKAVAAAVGEICAREGCRDWWERAGAQGA